MQSKFKVGMIAGLAAALLALCITFVVAGTPRPTTSNSKETVLQVANLSCGACLKTIETDLRKHKGMVSMTSDLTAGLITVKHSAELTPKRLAELVTAAGYPAKVAPASAATKQAAAAGTPGCGGCGPKGCKLPAPTAEKS